MAQIPTRVITTPSRNMGTSESSKKIDADSTTVSIIQIPHKGTVDSIRNSSIDSIMLVSKYK